MISHSRESYANLPLCWNDLCCPRFVWRTLFKTSLPLRYPPMPLRPCFTSRRWFLCCLAYFLWPNLLFFFVGSRKSLHMPHNGKPIFIAPLTRWTAVVLCDGKSIFITTFSTRDQPQWVSISVNLFEQDFAPKYLRLLPWTCATGRTYNSISLKFGTRIVVLRDIVLGIVAWCARMIGMFTSWGHFHGFSRSGIRNYLPRAGSELYAFRFLELGRSSSPWVKLEFVSLS